MLQWNQTIPLKANGRVPRLYIYMNKFINLFLDISPSLTIVHYGFFPRTSCLNGLFMENEYIYSYNFWWSRVACPLARFWKETRMIIKHVVDLPLSPGYLNTSLACQTHPTEEESGCTHYNCLSLRTKSYVPIRLKNSETSQWYWFGHAHYITFRLWTSKHSWVLKVVSTFWASSVDSIRLSRFSAPQIDSSFSSLGSAILVISHGLIWCNNIINFLWFLRKTASATDPSSVGWVWRTRLP